MHTERNRAACLLLATALLPTAAWPVLAQPAAPAAPEAGRAASSPGSSPRARARRPQGPQQPITVYDARIEAGDLRISGSLRRGGVVVVLDDEIPVMTDRNGRFLFKLPYRPRTCVATLKAGEDEREAVIANCAPEGETGPKGEPGPMGPQGIAGPKGVAGPQGAPGERGVPGPVGPAGPPGPAGPNGEPGSPGAAGVKGEAGARGEAGVKGEAGSKGEAGAKGEAGSGGATLRSLRAGACPETGCELACETGEALVSAYCLGGAGPSYRERTGGGVAALCPGGSAGMAAFCARP